MKALTRSISSETIDDRDREDGDDALHGDVVALVQVADQLRADPGPVERLLGQHGAAEQDRELQAGDGDDRDHRVAEGVVDDDAALADAAGAGRLDVVALHRLQQVDADQPDQHAADRQAEHQRRQDRGAGGTSQNALQSPAISVSIR